MKKKKIYSFYDKNDNIVYMGGEYCDKINLVVARVDENTKKLHNKLSNKLEKKF
ncbi:hypothetical protein DFH84_003909 [Clostridium saccharobutylicum]|uniref:hypothetical protein n=1 Tax=Clostridium saccharobutylicum TaxID=169679 RepID=UPI001493E2D6|nr:hypothetical protein [Clostridium saccharobutylicum]NOV93914.1 hypothetical protein [Clostridium saccharobutylicum]NOW12020.1 hypothetical protein [Clostridium saccharobutylicum]NOW62073.1 hypothetical protein [Clostridium saccharobutylicum]NYC43668.1 hypothetical protein [Clostridium saccharobutylicum]